MTTTTKQPATASDAIKQDREREQEEAQRKALSVKEGEPVPSQQTELHTWPDGSQAIGVPPFPDESPRERSEAVGEAPVAPMPANFIPHGMKQSGERPPVAPLGTTESEFKAKAEQQLAADVASGHDPHTVNPTSASDKPELANTDGTAGLEDPEKAPDLPTPEELAKIAADIKPTGNFKATDEQKAAAVAQVARETLGPIYPDADEKTEPAKKKR